MGLRAPSSIGQGDRTDSQTSQTARQQEKKKGIAFPLNQVGSILHYNCLHSSRKTLQKNPNQINSADEDFTTELCLKISFHTGF